MMLPAVHSCLRSFFFCSSDSLPSALSHARQYFYKWHGGEWYESAVRKFPHIKAATGRWVLKRRHYTLARTRHTYVCMRVPCLLFPLLHDMLVSFRGRADMLICGEDLGLLHPVVPQVMNEFHLLGLRVQRSAVFCPTFSWFSFAPSSAPLRLYHRLVHCLVGRTGFTLLLRRMPADPSVCTAAC